MTNMCELSPCRRLIVQATKYDATFINSYYNIKELNIFIWKVQCVQLIFD